MQYNNMSKWMSVSHLVECNVNSTVRLKSNLLLWSSAKEIPLSQVQKIPFNTPSNIDTKCITLPALPACLRSPPTASINVGWPSNLYRR